MEVKMKPRVGDRIKVIWVKSGSRNEKIFDKESEAHEFMCQLERDGAIYFYDWCK